MSMDSSDVHKRAEGVRRLDALPPERAEEALKACCGSSAWVKQMLARRPFSEEGAVYAAAEAVWAEATERDWLEAFRAHPRIGATKAAATQGATAASWSKQEQAGVADAAADTRAALAAVNDAYEARHGFIYIVCATGKSVDEMLSLARARLDNDRETELRAAAGEQAKITRIRLEKLLQS
jgi:OHCU decarboxylase